jgi:hypothetical protein
MLALPPPTSAKLAKVIALLGSDQPGEVVAAAAAATRLLRAHGATWADLLRPCPAPQPRPQAHATGGHRARALRLLAHSAGRLDDWQAGFLRSIAGQVRPLSPRQEAALRRIEERCR